MPVVLRNGERGTLKEHDDLMDDRGIPHGYRGWWRIVETSQWADDHLDILGPAMISLTGHGDRLRMLALLAYVNCKPTKTGVSFAWQGAWEYDQVRGTGRVRLRKDGRLKGTLKIKDGDESTFVAVRAEEPEEAIPDPPRYRDKWRR
ncbi:MAG TPA: hypothetical protein ENL35_08610 [Chloroflexi bacterium]|nr:hypothetical protein [Chloroflexota bacterium]